MRDIQTVIDSRITAIVCLKSSQMLVSTMHSTADWAVKSAVSHEIDEPYQYV